MLYLIASAYCAFLFFLFVTDQSTLLSPRIKILIDVAWAWTSLAYLAKFIKEDKKGN